jgi:F-type H+-transporting ATPase subunit b
MPQLTQLSDVAYSQFFWLLLTLAVIYFGIGRAMLPKIQSTVDARDNRIAEDLAAAERAKAEAEATEEAYRLAMDQARAEALKVTQAAKVKTAKDAETRLHAADAELATKATAAEASLRAASAAAVSDIESIAAQATEEIVAKLTGMKLGKADAAKAVKAAMANV